jgi:hypothetical protein
MSVLAYAQITDFLNMMATAKSEGSAMVVANPMAKAKIYFRFCSHYILMIWILF